MEEFLSHIHFLRPQWLWGMMIIALISIMLFAINRRKEAWRDIISKDILPFLIIRGDRVSGLPRIILIVVLILMVLALAGPTWEKVEKPGGKIEAALVILVDASRSMLADDIQPNRLERSKQKISDLLNASPGAHVAVVAYAGTAHLVIPFTRDYKTINYQLESLSPGVMPVKGTNLEGALLLADSLLGPIEAPSTILVFTDDATDEDLDAIKALEASDNKIEYFALATPSGAAIPLGNGLFLKDDNGTNVLVNLNIDRLKDLGKQPGVNITTVTLDASDVERLATNIRRNLVYSRDPEAEDEEWQDAGYWLVVPIALLVLFWFRRGWMVQWIVLLVISIPFSSCSGDKDIRRLQLEALPGDWTFTDLWFTRDQQGQRLKDEGNSMEAFDRFEDPRQKAMILYQMDSLEAAASIYATIPNATGFYNLGVIQAELNKFPASRDAFEKALEADPGFTAAQENLELINRIIAERRSRYHAPTSLEDRLFGQSQENQELQDMEGELEETSGGKKQPDEMKEMAAGMAPQQDDIMIAEMDAGLNSEDAKDVVLRQLSDDPSVFMKRKFLHQVMSGKVKQKETMEMW
jgi:Ca-activated chloride channel family protein